jgi:hypothetical protein
MLVAASCVLASWAARTPGRESSGAPRAESGAGTSGSTETTLGIRPRVAEAGNGTPVACAAASSASQNSVADT